ncbi:MAG: rhomboid family intramembrane serine protease [Crocinitomicaceae bacterium]|nr:rhomboid family intramembrane serine protease [Crocinitomicaceae bacterium]
MPPVVKNLLIINVLFFLATIVMQNQEIFLIQELGMHYIDSPIFKPYQIATHFFMHADLFHIFFNMFALVVFGSHLERQWGPKRFLMFYFITAIGATFLHTLVQGIEIYRITDTFFPVMNDVSLTQADYVKVTTLLYTPSVGASGAVYGLIMAFAMLFPNTQFQLLFPPIPIKAKWLAVGLGVLALYQGFKNAEGDSVAHFAHLGGMLFGFIMIKLWQRNRNQFY